MLLAATFPLWAGYKIKEPSIKAALEYPAHQDFQKLVLAAQPFLTEDESLELFDTKKLYERNIMPVLVVVQNNNDFAVRLESQDIYLIDKNETNVPSIPYEEVLVRIALKNPRGAEPQILIRQIKDKNLLADFEHKAFGKKLIAPHDSDWGVVFFPRPDDSDLQGYRLYFPEIFNMANDEPLMFFEFRLGKGKE